MIFKKSKMLDRLTKDGLLSQVNEEVIKIMDKIDGGKVVKNDFQALVFDNIEYGVMVDGKFYQVNLDDCE